MPNLDPNDPQVKKLLQKAKTLRQGSQFMTRI